jgi:hypothetical protein
MFFIPSQSASLTSVPVRFVLWGARFRCCFSSAS